MSNPIPVKVTRFRCPHCPRTASSKARTREHIARCWRNPEVKGCKTCRHFLAAAAEYDDYCAVGVDLTGRPECDHCKGSGFDPAQTWDSGAKCPVCHGKPEEIKPGPIVGCEKWEAPRGAEA